MEGHAGFGDDEVRGCISVVVDYLKKGDDNGVEKNNTV